MRYALYTVTLLALLLTTSLGAWSQGAYTRGELDELLGPIALYPDPLLAQVLPAATFPDQLQAAYDLVRSGGSGLIDSQPWDVSVRAVAHYPDVLTMMVNNLDWTIAVGQAYISQPTDVMNAVQRLRFRARSLGYLTSNPYEVVTVSNGYIAIVPAQPAYIYVPTYSPAVVYERPRSSFARDVILFGTGLLIGSWLNRDVDWHHHRVYYHGWHGRGWIGRSRAHVNINNRHYVNPAFVNRPITVNRNVEKHNITSFRRDIKRNMGKFAPPGLVTPGVTPTRPITPRTRPVKPGVRPKPGVVTPGVQPTPTKPGLVTPKPTTPAVPGAGPRVRKARPTPKPGAVVTPPVLPTPPAKGHGAIVTHPVTPRPHAVPKVQPGRGPREGMTRPAPHARPMAPVMRPAPRERPVAPMMRPSRPSAPVRTAPARPSGGQRGARPEKVKGQK